MKRIYGCYFFMDSAGFTHIDYREDEEPLMYAPGELGFCSFPDGSIKWAKDVKTCTYYMAAGGSQFMQR